ncbi:MAG: DeoR/GlpR family DNA-binding transcription regulator [Clostridia bacterium]
MSKTARIRRIKEILLEQKKVDIPMLSNLLDVSGVTVRSDLEQLENEGVLYRTHGGAVLRELLSSPSETNLSQGPLSVSENIRQVAVTAAEYIKDKEWIFLGSGSTCCSIAHALCTRNINIVTNNLSAALVFMQNKSANILLTGGNMFANNNPFLYGDFFAKSLENILFDKAFVGVSGVDIHFGYSVSNSVECSVFSKIKSVSKETIVVADITKFRKTSFMGIGPLTHANTVITNRNVPEEYCTYFADHSIKLLLSTG